MCRYAISGPYKSHYACFLCRKSFKQPPIEDWLKDRDRDGEYKQLVRLWWQKEKLSQCETTLGVRLEDLQSEYRDSAHRCPECGEPMIDMGRDFKSPRQSDKKAWRILQGMFRVGHAFHTCGCDGPGYIPKNPSEYRQYLLERRSSFVQQLELVQNSAEITTEAKNEAGIYWLDRIGKIDAELSAV